MNTRLLLVFFLLLAAGFASAQVYEITAHTIQIEVDGTGNAEITEKFFLFFRPDPAEEDLKMFREESQKMGVDLVAWERFNPSFKPTIGSREHVIVSDIGFIENDSKYLEIKYTLDEALMKREKETSRMVEFALKAKFFNNFLEGSFWVIPSNVTIIVDLPLQTEVQLPVRPEANISGNRIVWTGYKSTNVLSLRYVVWKQIASFNLNELVAGIRNSPAFPLVVAAIALLAVALFFKRKAISARIEAYIVEHSKLSAGEEED